MGESIVLKVELEMPEIFKDIALNVRMNDVYGNGIAAWRSREMGIEIRHANYRVIELEIQQLNVFDGHYNLSLSLLDNNQVIDFHDSILNLEIVPSELEIFGGMAVSKSHNIIYTPARWAIY